MSKFKKGDKAIITYQYKGGAEGDCVWSKGSLVEVTGYAQGGRWVDVTATDGTQGYCNESELELIQSANQFELKGYTETRMYVDHRFVSGVDEAKEYIESAQGPSNAVSYKLFEHVPAGEFKVSAVTTRTVSQV